METEWPHREGIVRGPVSIPVEVSTDDKCNHQMQGHLLQGPSKPSDHPTSRCQVIPNGVTIPFEISQPVPDEADMSCLY